ncbi:TPR-like protein [Zopfia rhizophila CBS 207.26]|uniref:TPR-like protein n=1 Tax=Zopfia rhizophila CBS 207.26 TaxID=1314779 RepID=A0A6A6EM74_9PEZI|nr:TPR-like protein [Zopfia rhizophila CBS 207.26]
MNSSTANPPVFGQPDLLHPIHSPDVLQLAYEPYSGHLALDSLTLQTQPLDGQVTTSQSHLSHSFDPFPTLHTSKPYTAESFSDTQVIPATPMGPPTNSRKRKALTLRADAWEPYKARIIELHITQGLPLREVKKKIEEELGFTAELRQYRTRISQWGKDKNIKPKEMRAIVKKRQQRKVIEVNKSELVFQVRGYEVEPQRIDRWMKRHEVPESLLYAPTTPSAVYCRTISERGSPIPSPMYSSQTPNFLPADIISIVQSPVVFSPTPSVSSIVRPQSSDFTGQSPAPTYQSLPSFRPSSSPASNVFQGQSTSVEPFVQYRYKQTDEEHLREELSKVEVLYGMSHPKTLDILSELGNVLIDQGRYRSAEETIRRLVEGRRIANGNDDVNVLDALELLGRVLGRQGLYTKAEKLHQRTLGSRRAILGDEHSSTLTSMANLALAYWNQGRWKEAEELNLQVMETRKRVLGEEHPSTLISMGNLALAYSNQGRWKEAEELEVQVMETRKRVLEEEHPNTLTSMANLASTYSNQGRWKEAEELKVQVLERSGRVFGEEHPDTLTSMANLASTYRHQGRWKEAEELEVQVLERSVRVFGEEHPDTLTSMGNLALTYRDQGRWKEAEELEVQVLETGKRVLREEHPDMLASMNNLAMTYSNQGRWKEAEELEVCWRRERGCLERSIQTCWPA